MVHVKDPTLTPSLNDDLCATTWLERVTQNRTTEESEQIRHAYFFASEMHQENRRPSSELYLLHVMTVADILADLGMETSVLIAALLHEGIMQNLVTLEAVKQRFGEAVYILLKEINKMKFIDELNDNLTFEESNQRESLRRMLLAIVKDVRVMIIILADRLHDMRVLKHFPRNIQQRFAKETTDLFAPLANRLGIGQIKWELEDLALRYLQPDTYQAMARLLDEKRLYRESYIQEVIHDLEQELMDNGIKAQISGRPKHIYSIWRKMQRKGVPFNQIFDVRAVRVIVSNIRECYEVLGIVHNRWRPVPNEFDDYIANPKSNDYRSLHTAVFGPEDKIFEVQIRTDEMHRHAELGVAAHWRYKEQSVPDDDFSHKIAWLRQIPQWKEEAQDNTEFIDRVKSEIFEDRVYVFTPKGKVIDLPQGSTPLDFAYHIHTDLGHRCRGAKINNRIVPLTYTLKNAEQVEIIPGSKERPSRDWVVEELGYVKTSRARSKIKQWLRKQDFQQHVQEGRQILERELKRLNLNEVHYETLAHRFQQNSVEHLFAALGRGDITPPQITHCFTEQILVSQKPALPSQPTTRTIDGIYVRGVSGLMTELAGCCNPVPPEAIIGYVSRGRGVVIHRQDCVNVSVWQNQRDERLIEVEWGQPQQEERNVYPVEIEVFAFERTGLLRDITSLATEENINIVAANTSSNKQDYTVRMNFKVEVEDLDQLSKWLSRIDSLINVMEVRRC